MTRTSQGPPTVSVAPLSRELVELARALEPACGDDACNAVWSVDEGVGLLYAGPGAPRLLLEAAAERLAGGETNFELYGPRGARAAVHVCRIGDERVAYGLFVTTAPHLAQTIDALIDLAEAEVGKAVAEMSRVEKQQVVRFLDRRGAFLIRKAVEDVADRLGVTRFTIYNYLDRDERR